MEPVSLNRQEFERLVAVLADQIIDAAAFRKLHADIRNSIEEYWREFNQSNTFWVLSSQAIIEACLSRLSRIYVSHNKALSLESWLTAIKENPDLFSTVPLPLELEADLCSVTTEGEPAVEKLVKLRGNVIAHISWKDITRNLNLGSAYGLTDEEIELLISRAHEILNRYSVLFNHEHWARGVVGQSDFMNTLKAVRSHIEQVEAEIEASIRESDLS